MTAPLETAIGKQPAPPGSPEAPTMADVELLPCGQCGMPCRAGEYHPFAACLMFKACHNSETVRANLAPLQAEVEALRAEVETWKTFARGKHGLWQESVRRAERLAEALALLPDEIVMVEHNPDGAPRMFCCGREVKLSWLHDLQPTHNEECWYARMRAMRDAALGQEE